MLRLSQIFVMCLAAAVLASGQSPEGEVEDTGFVITTESNLVVVPFHVYQKKSSVNGLRAEQFELLEDGQPQKIAFLEGPPSEGGVVTPRSVPTEIIFLIDFSYSVMTPGLLDFTTVRKTMLEGLREDVMISVYGFSHSLKRFTGPTRDVAKLQRALDMSFKSESGGSKVYEAIMQTARDATSRGSNVSRMMVIFSDGLSTTKLDPNLVVQSANALGIPLYPVILGHEWIMKRGQGRGGNNVAASGRHSNLPDIIVSKDQNIGPRQNPGMSMSRGANAREQEKKQALFADIGPRTGGRSYDLSIINSKVMRQILGSLSELAETEYVAGYYPSETDEELTGHLVELHLKDETVGKMFGGRRIVVH